jgi:uncharacterized repeat protein (TIGR01451 family)
MRIRSLFKKLRQMPKRYVMAVAAGIVIAVPLAVSAGYGPNRPVFDWNNPEDRKGSATGPVFNSFINTPTYGDERAFVDARESTNTAGNFADTIDVVGGKEYTVRAYVHNNANQATNDAAHNYIGVAKNAKIKFKVLPGTANGNEITGFISADNATPTMVYDTVKLKSDTTAFSLEYVPGSARMESNVHPYPGIPLPDSVATDEGALLGDSQDGNLPGCFEYTEIVTIKVRVKTPNLTIQKGVTTVEAPAPTDLKENITVKPGDAVTWRIDYKNNGTGTADNITIRDSIPAGLTLVPGSIKRLDSNHLTGETIPDTGLSSGGVNVGNYPANTNGVIRFRTTVNRDTQLCEITNIAFGRADNVAESQDSAKITIDSDVCKPKNPVYSCDLLTVELVNGRTYKYTVNATATGGATITQYVFNFGDNQTANSSSNSVQHTYASTVSSSPVTVAKVQVRVNGEDKIAESALCAKPVSFTATPPPTTLPNTGPGNIVGLFGAVSVAGAAIHRFVLSRRYGA